MYKVVGYQTYKYQIAINTFLLDSPQLNHWTLEKEFIILSFISHCDIRYIPIIQEK